MTETAKLTREELSALRSCLGTTGLRAITQGGPNAPTWRALARKGYLLESPIIGDQWRTYRLTEKGSAALEAEESLG